MATMETWVAMAGDGGRETQEAREVDKDEGGAFRI